MRAAGGEIAPYTPDPDSVPIVLSPGAYYDGRGWVPVDWAGCTDSAPDSTWTCIEGDGTGLWCDACKRMADTLADTGPPVD